MDGNERRGISLSTRPARRRHPLPGAQENRETNGEGEKRKKGRERREREREKRGEKGKKKERKKKKERERGGSPRRRNHNVVTTDLDRRSREGRRERKSDRLVAENQGNKERGRKAVPGSGPDR